MKLAGRRVLVTGADGFIGSHVVEALLAEGAEVRAFVLYNAGGSWGWLETLPAAARAAIETVSGDVRDQSTVEEAVKGVSAIFHLAGLIGVPYSYRAPDAYFDCNVKGTLNVLQAARRHDIERLLVTSTSEVYGSARTVPMDESHPLQASSPYAASKIASDKLAESFSRSFGMPIAVVRPFSAYGPRQSARAVIPTVIAQLLGGAQVLRLGSLTPRRDYTYVADIADGFVAIARSDRTLGEEINIANGIDHSIGDIVARLVTLLRPNTRIETDNERLRPAQAEVDCVRGTNDKLRALTDWVPRTGLDEGLEQTIRWFQMPGMIDRYKPGRYAV